MSQWKGYGPDNVLPADAGVADGPQSLATSSALTYEPHYGLTAKPFSLSTDPRALYKSPAHSAVLEDLLSGIRRREGIVVLTGEMGTGKTMLCRAALYQLDRKTFTTFVPDPFLSREDLLRMLLVDFGEVSVDDLRRGRLSGASRPDLSYQLYEFLTSLESVDAFAVLVIDEAQHLAQPLLEEIRALSELEAGRRLLQIVLVGQPELQTRLKQLQMRQIDQRVTMRCELRPLSKEEVADYVSHRLATVGGTQDRIAFASAAIDLIHAASNGVPRVVNVICDRAMTLAHVDRVSVVGPPLVTEAIDELQLMTATAAPAPPSSAPSSPAGLFDRRRAPEARATTSELHALLDIPATAAKRDAETTPDRVHAGPTSVPVWKWRMDRDVRREARTVWLKTVGLAVLAMAVMLIAGGIAFTSQRSPSVTARAASSAQTVAPTQSASPATVPSPAPPSTPAANPPAAAPALTTPVATLPAVTATAPAPVPSDSWVVQVGAFSSRDRSQALVQRLTQSGFAAFEVPSDAANGRLYFVRVGPFKTAGEADEARAVLRGLGGFESAFVRSVTPVP